MNILIEKLSLERSSPDELNQHIKNLAKIKWSDETRMAFSDLVYQIYKQRVVKEPAFRHPDFLQKLAQNIKFLIENKFISLADFLTSPVAEPEKNLQSSILWSGVFKSLFKHLFSANILSHESPEKIWTGFLKAVQLDFCSEKEFEWMQKSYDLTVKKEELMHSVHSFSTLFKLEKSGFDIWTVLKKNHEIETLFPFYVLEYETLRSVTEYKEKMPLEDRVSFIHDNRLKWQDIKTAQTTNKQFKNQLILAINRNTTEKDFKAYLKELDLTIKDILPEQIDCHVQKTTYLNKTQDMLLKYGKYSTLNHLKIDSFSLPQLLVSNPGSLKAANYKTTHKEFTKLWFSLLKKTDFKNDITLLPEFLIKKTANKNRCYLPLKKKYLDYLPDTSDSCYDSFYSILVSADSLEKVLTLFENKETNFQARDKNNELVLKLLTEHLLKYEDYSDKTLHYFYESGLVYKEFQKLPLEDKIELAEGLLSSWATIFDNSAEKRFNDRYRTTNPYKHKFAVVYAIEMIIDACEQKIDNELVLFFIKKALPFKKLLTDYAPDAEDIQKLHKKWERLELYIKINNSLSDNEKPQHKRIKI